MVSRKLVRLWNLLREGVEREVFPGAVAALYRNDRYYILSVGWRATFPRYEPNEEDTFYDLASLTKPLATTLVVMKLVSEGRLSLEHTLARFFPKDWFKESFWQRATLRDLLSHSAGLPAWRPYYRNLLSLSPSERKIFLWREILTERPSEENLRRGTYSDLGFFLLQAVIERVSERSLEENFDRVYRELFPGCSPGLLFRPLSFGIPVERIAPTERCPFRRCVLRGEVHDENTWALGGVSGAAGLFGTAQAVRDLLVRMLRAYQGEEEPVFLNRDLVRTFWDYRSSRNGRALGFDQPSSQGSSAGPFFSRRSVGHLGFTGTSFWVDPERDLVAVLLSNRVHPFRNNEKLRAFRVRFYTEAALG